MKSIEKTAIINCTISLNRSYVSNIINISSCINACNEQLYLCFKC